MARLSVADEGRTLVERLGGRWTAAGGMGRCPAHEDRTPSLSIRPGRTRLLFHCFAGCAAADVLAALERLRLLDPAAAAPEARREGRADRSRSSAALRIWEQSRAVSGTPAAAYLAARGVPSGSAELRYHPRAPDGPRPLTRLRPALIAAVRDERGLVAVHRTFLDSGAAGRAADRRALGRLGAGAIRFGGAGPEMGLAEGIETALSATALFGLPCWAALGAERFGRIALPPQVERLHLFLDSDRGGRRAEALARAAFAHISMVAHYPERSGADWNDALRERPA